MARLDPRFETLGNGGPASLPILEGRWRYPDWPPELHPIGVKHRAFVLLQPGQRLPDFVQQNAVQLAEAIYIVEGELDLLRSLANHPAVVYVEAPRPIGSELDTSVKDTKADQLWSTAAGVVDLTGKGVVVGIIDTEGLDWKLDDFRDPNTGATRVLSIWDQSLATNSPPGGFPYGVEYGRKQIDDDLNGVAPIAHVREAGSHGTHVAGIAAGNGRSTGPDPHNPGVTLAQNLYIGIAYEAEIVYVKTACVPGTTLTSTDRVAEAIKYIFDKAGTTKPCVINLSIGGNGGAHDGESIVERAIDLTLEARGRVLVKSAGNEGGWNCHASQRLTATDPRCTLEWKFGKPGYPDRTANEMEIWYSSRDRLAITIEGPNASSSAIIPGQPRTHSFSNLGNAIVTISSMRFHPLNGASYVHIHIDKAPGAFDLGTDLWKVIVEIPRGELIRDGHIDAWIERDDRDDSYSYADQSVFQTYVDASRSLTPPGTIRRGITVGNFDHRKRATVASSSAGPTRDRRLKPDLGAPGDSITSSGARGNEVDPSGHVYPVRTVLTGSSMSAPHVTGICALLLQAVNDLTSAQIAAALIACAAPISTQAYDDQTGFGAVDAASAATMVR
jgi:subtilisin family serine protease